MGIRGFRQRIVESGELEFDIEQTGPHLLAFVREFDCAFL
jgi:hypothetical protein